jgi:hypothetical protein
LGDVNEQSSVKWMKDGSKVLSEHDDDARRRIKVDSTKHFLLTIVQVSTDDAGVYDCALFGEQDQFKFKSARRYRLIVDGSLIVSNFHSVFSSISRCRTKKSHLIWLKLDIYNLHTKSSTLAVVVIVDYLSCANCEQGKSRTKFLHCKNFWFSR